MSIGKKAERLIYKNKASYILFLFVGWPLAVLSVFLSAVSHSIDAFFAEFIDTWEELFYWPCLTKEHFDAKQKKAYESEDE